MGRAGKRDSSGSMFLSAEERQDLLTWAPKSPEQLHWTAGRLSSVPNNSLYPSQHRILTEIVCPEKKHTSVKDKVSYKRDQDKNCIETIQEKRSKVGENGK